MPYVQLLALGLVAGVFAGMFGIGGGLIIVPSLMFLFGFKELNAIGTSLAALVLPVGLLGAFEYHRNGYIDIRVAALIAAGLFFGTLIGAKIVIGLPPVLIRRLYAGFLIAVAAKMLVTGK